MIGADGAERQVDIFVVGRLDREVLADLEEAAIIRIVG